MKENNMKENKLEFLKSFDAWDWARDFCEIVRNHPNVPYDEETMMGWFANALMRGWDEKSWRQDKEDENRWIYILKDWQNGEVVALYSEEPTKEKCDRNYSLHLGEDLEWSVKNIVYTSGQDSSWNCVLHRMKVDSLNRMNEQIEIRKLEPYEKI
jgi:hypothetical protein